MQNFLPHRRVEDGEIPCSATVVTVVTGVVNEVGWGRQINAFCVNAFVETNNIP